MEADLSRYHGIDYRDRWRPDVHGRPRLTLRMIYVRVRELPRDSAVARRFPQAPPIEALQLALLHSIWQITLAQTGKPGLAAAKRGHPALREARRAAQTPDPDRERNLAAARQRIAARKARIAAGEIT